MTIDESGHKFIGFLMVVSADMEEDFVQVQLNSGLGNSKVKT